MNSFTSQPGSGKTFARVLHYTILFAMLHSTFVAPAQGLIDAWLHHRTVLKYKGFRGDTPAAARVDLPELQSNEPAGAQSGKVLTPVKQYNTTIPGVFKYGSDMAEGIIGVSKDKPIDNPFDNIFNISLDRLPQPGEKVYLTYELFGVSGYQSVARSINDRFSTGGYVVKLQQGWSTQKEELDAEWLKLGINKVLFTIPNGAGYQYKVKNLSLQIEKSNEMEQVLVLHSQNSVLTKDGKIYIKGFLRGNHQGLKVQAGNTLLDVNDNEFEGYVTLDQVAKDTGMIAVSAVGDSSFLGRELLFLNNLMEADKGFAIENKNAKATKLFTAHTSSSLSVEGASIMVNDSALVQDHEISIAKLRDIDIAPMESSMINVTKGGKAYRFLPDGTTFNKPINISIAYDTLLLPAGYTAKDIRTYYFDTNNKKWRQVQKDTIDTKSHVVTSTTTHFTDYINGIIQAPESPETSAFMPTMMNDIKAADPSAEITLIAPPQASQKGDANISYPIKIPAGRNGMQPQLAVQYSSGNGQGWLGQGWSLSVPSLSIDSRWGVPLFDPVNESELYSLNGEMLMYPNGYLPHRHYGETGYNVITQARGSGTKQFTPRRQGSYTKIERMGGWASAYYWKVTGTDGTISWYGGKDGVVENAVIRRGASNTPIIHWALYMVEDVFGNNIKYSYTASTISGLSGAQATLNGSKEHYLAEIKYTGYNGSDGDYSVVFSNQTTIRQDVTFSSRLGVKQSASRLLDAVYVKFQNTVIRKYQFDYINGRFDKMLLSRVTELDNNNKEFYHHDFEYYDDVAENDGKLFGETKTVYVPPIAVDYGDVLGLLFNLGNLVDASLLNTVQNVETSLSLKPSAGIQVRVGSYNNSPTKTLLVGMPFGKNNVKSRGRVTFTDIDGDGLDDLLFQTYEGLKYYPGTVTVDEQGNMVNGFDYIVKSVHNMPEFSVSESETKTLFGHSWDVAFLDFFGGKQRTKTKSESKVYTVDANNDGLLDVVINGIVHFSHLDPVTNEPTYTTGSEVTPNLVIMGNSPVGEPGELPEEQEEQEQQQEFNDDYDLVRVWVVPVDGAGYFYSYTENYGPGNADITIERKLAGGSQTELFYHLPITYGVAEVYFGSGTTFNKGDIYYFRLHHNETGSNPNIKFHIGPIWDMNTPYGWENDGTGYYRSHVLSADMPEVLPGTGTVKIEWPTFTPTSLTDTQYYRIYQRTTNAQGVNTDVLVYPPSSSPTAGICTPPGTTSVSATTNLNQITVNNENTSFVFEVWSQANAFKWGPGNGDTFWRPKLTYTPSQAASDDGVAAYTKYVVPHYNIYHAHDNKGFFVLMPKASDPTSPSWTTVTTSQTYGVKPNVTVTPGYLTTSDNAEFVFMVRNASGIAIDSRKVIVTNGVVTVSNSSPVTICSSCAVTTQANSNNYSRYKFEFYVDESEIEVFEKYLLATANKITQVGYGTWTTTQSHYTTAVSVYYNDLKQLGPMLDNWGQFLYNEDYDTDPATPTSAYGKLINTNIVMNPFNNLALPSSPLLNNNCDPNLPNDEYMACVEQSLADAANIPDDATDFDTIDVDDTLSDMETGMTDFNFELPFMAMQPAIIDDNLANDKWVGLYNSQYSQSVNMRAGSFEEIDSSSSGGGGLSLGPIIPLSDVMPLTANATTGMGAVNKIHKSSASNTSIGWTQLGVKSKSKTNYSYTITDFTDLNGDGYPDILTTENLQKTSMTGGHLQAVSNPETGNPVSSSSQYGGIVLTRTFLNAGRNVMPKTVTPAFKGTNSHSIVNCNPSAEPVGIGTNYTEAFAPSASTDGGPAINRLFNALNDFILDEISDSTFEGEDKTEHYWMDLNGDGLPDRIEPESSVYKYQLNKGQDVFNGSFEAFNYLSSLLTTPEPEDGNNYDLPIAEDLLNDIDYILPVSVRAGYSYNKGNTKRSFADINGDGLVDFVEGGNVRLNSGLGFTNPLSLSSSSGTLNLDGDSLGLSLAAGGTVGAYYGFPICCAFIPVLHIKFGLTFDADASTTLAMSNKMFKDVDGDGYADFIRFAKGSVLPNDHSFKVNYSNIKRTNMLKTVHNPLGGSFTMDYAANVKTHNNHTSRWVMTGVVINDGYDKANDGADTYLTHFEYENAYYDRRERDFYGFETVKTISYNLDESGEPTTVYRTAVSKYNNQSYFLNGLLKESYILKGGDENAIFSRTVNTYEVNKLNTNGTIDLTATVPLTYDTGGTEGRRSAVVLLTETQNFIYELGTTPLVSTTQMEYNNLGRVIKYIYLGGTGTADNYSAEIDYYSTATLQSHNLIDIPQEIRIKDNSNAVVRKRNTGYIDESTGTIGSVTVKLNNTEDAVTEMEHDSYGNLIQVALPPNENGEQMVYNYEYDPMLHKYITSVTDSYGYSSLQEYHPWFDKVMDQMDIAGNITHYDYDNFGRMAFVIGPKEMQSGAYPYTINFEYYPTFNSLYEAYSSSCYLDGGNFIPVAITSHYDEFHPSNDIQTYTFIDGLGRPIQIKKDIELNTGTPQSPSYTEMMSISGKMKYDAFGRVTEQFHPYYEAKDCAVNLAVNEYEAPYSSLVEYDEIDRTVKTTDAEGNISTVEYSIDNDFFSAPAMKVKSITQQTGSVNIITEKYTDVNGRVTSTKNVLTTGTPADIWTRFSYNSIGELISYTDAENISTSYVYDLAGRKLQLNHPDNGITNYAYDRAGHLISVQTANLSADTSLQPADRFIKYDYEYNRPVGIVYPPVLGSDNIANVVYSYGTTGNDKGRLTYQQDATGEQFFEYGSMGEVISNTRVVVGPNIPTRTFTTSFEYDSWNRIKSMVYPDGEELTYNYNLGGNLTNITGEIDSAPYEYIKQIDYDYYEQRTYLKYGNNTETSYSYTPALRRLNTLAVNTSMGDNMFNNSYSYDRAGNVTQISNMAAPNPVNLMGGEYEHSYYYDNLNRLTYAWGYFYGDEDQEENNNTYYSDYGMLMEYNNTHGIIMKDLGHYVDWNVNPANTYTNEYTYTSGTHRVESIEDVNSTLIETFTYDLNGNIVNRSDTDLNSKDYYWDESNRLRVVDDQTAMQHYIYDAGGQRVLKASSQVQSVYENGTLTSSSVTFDAYTTYPSAFIVVDSDGQYSKHYYSGSQRIVSRIGEETAEIFEENGGGRLAAPQTVTEAEKPLDEVALRNIQVKDLAQLLAKKSKAVPAFAPYEKKEEQVAPEEDDAGSVSKTLDGPTTNNVPQQPPYANIYFYHPDHLGSSTYLTDANGMPYQFFLNLPFGETMAEQHSLTEDYATPYKFNGKELDAETGLYYYGARYYDPKTSIWLSVDPLVEKTNSSYGYCYQNPVRLIDPDGKFPIIGAIGGFFKGLIASKSDFEQGAKTRLGNAIRSAARYEKQSWQITAGLFATDKNRTCGGQALQLISRFTWELPQTVLGYFFSLGTNFLFNTTGVESYAGATIISTTLNSGAMTVGSFIMSGDDIQANPDQYLFQHEYGHVLQSQVLGPFYLAVIAVPSILSTIVAFASSHVHDNFYAEQDANKRAYRYWKRTIKNYKGWKLYMNPINNQQKLKEIEGN